MSEWDVLDEVLDAWWSGLAVLASDGTIARTNAVLQQLIDRSEAELIGVSLAELGKAESDDERALLDTLLAGGRTEYRIAKRIERTDGKTVWLSQIVRRTGNLPVIASFEDTTAMRDAEAQRRELAYSLGERVKELTALHAAARVMFQRGSAEKQLDIVVELLPPAMQFPSITTAAIRFRAAVYATPNHTPTRWMLRAPFETSNGDRGEIEVAYSEERAFLVEETALLESLAEMARIALDRHAAENALSDANERMELAFDIAGAGVWEWDVTRNITRWSVQLSRMVGIEETVGTFGRRSDLMHPDDRDRVLGRLQRAADGLDDLRDLEVRFRRPDGGWRPMITRSKIERMPPARATRIITAMVDISEQRALEEAFRNVQKFEILGQVATGVAHDFKNLLMIMTSGTALLAEEVPPDHPLREIVDDLAIASERGVALTRQLLAFSGRSPIQPRAVDLSDVVATLEPLIRRLAIGGIRFDVQLDRAIGRVWSDVSQLEHAVMNLAVNARDALPHGGAITITTSTRITGTSKVAVIEVRDTGTGIDPSLHQQIFEAFFTTKERGKGTGLGLAMVAGVARQWGGWTELDSEPGRGSAFRMCFPLL